MPGQYFDPDDDELDDELDTDFDENDDDEPEAGPAEEDLAALDRAFRDERARIRRCDDLATLREMRREHDANSTARRYGVAGRMRSRDLVELIDDRITDVKARHLADRNR